MTESIPVLGKLSRIDLREVWKSEPYSFTPWLAQPANLNSLAEALGLGDLELVQTEQQVSEFSVDIVAKMVGTDELVVIENQLERTDHSHLGQALTYAAGTKARAIVWVAQRFAEGHRAALDWLNSVTSEEIGFFGVEIEAWRIGDSPPAPQFNVVARPNEWARRVREASTAPSPEASKNIAYWEAFNLVADEKGLWPDPGAGKKGNNVYLKLFKDTELEVFSAGFVSRSGAPSIGAYLYFDAGNPESLEKWAPILNGLLEEASAAVAAEVTYLPRSEKLVWLMTRRLCQPDDQDSWKDQHEWLADRMVQFRDFFQERIAPFIQPNSSFL